MRLTGQSKADPLELASTTVNGDSNVQMTLEVGRGSGAKVRRLKIGRSPAGVKTFIARRHRWG